MRKSRKMAEIFFGSAARKVVRFPADGVAGVPR
jgi:hypothetical protein